MESLQSVLDKCLSAIAAGELTPEQCLARYPKHAKALRPLLRAAERTAAARPIGASPEFRARSRARLQAHMRAHPRGGNALRPQPRRLFAMSLALAVALFAVTTASAQSALPGTALYGWKRASEAAWVAVQPSSEARLVAELAIAERRLVEAQAVADDPARAAIALQGYAEAMQAVQQLTAERPELAAQADAALAVQSDRLKILQDVGLKIPDVRQDPPPTADQRSGGNSVVLPSAVPAPVATGLSAAATRVPQSQLRNP